MMWDHRNDWKRGLAFCASAPLSLYCWHFHSNSGFLHIAENMLLALPVTPFSLPWCQAQIHKSRKGFLVHVGSCAPLHPWTMSEGQGFVRGHLGWGKDIL